MKSKFPKTTSLKIEGFPQEQEYIRIDLHKSMEEGFKKQLKHQAEIRKEKTQFYRDSITQLMRKVSKLEAQLGGKLEQQCKTKEKSRG